MKNTGTTTWGTSTHKLGSQNPANNMTWGLNRAALYKATPVGSMISFTFNVTAPSTSGIYNFQWQMVNDSTGAFFGQAMPNLAVQVGSGGGSPTDNASFVSQSVPSSMTAGQTVGVSVTMANSGTTTWQAGSYSLGSLNPAGNTTWGLSSVSLASSVAPGSNATFSFNVTAPSAAGTYNFQWGMKNGTSYFGTGSTNVAVTVSSPAGADNAQFISQSVPASMNIGQIANVSVVMNNNGTTTWLPGTYTLVSRNPAGNTIWGLGNVALNSSVGPGSNWTFSFSITAPSTAGTYNFQWQMSKNGVGFGAMSTNIGVTVSSSSVQPLVLTTTTVPNGVLNQAYSQQIVASGGVQPYNWSISSGVPAPGLTLNSSTGLLGGTPTTVGTYNFTVTVRDLNGSTASKSFKMAVR
jgi:hypothetical protein